MTQMSLFLPLCTLFVSLCFSLIQYLSLSVTLWAETVIRCRCNNKQKVGGEDEGDSRHHSGQFNNHPVAGSPLNIGLVELRSLWFTPLNDRGHVDRTQMYQSMNRGGSEREKDLNGEIWSNGSKRLIQMTPHSDPCIIFCVGTFFSKVTFQIRSTFSSAFHGQGNQFNRDYLWLFITAIAKSRKVSHLG